MHELKIVQKDTSKLSAYKHNARTHTDEQIEQIANSIKTFGFNNPILVDKHSIIAGHGRLAAAKLLGIKLVPTIELTHLTEAQKKAYVIADNKIALNAGWDLSLLQQEFNDIITANEFDVHLTGFDKEELDAILNPESINEGLCDPDEVPEIQPDPITKLGDVWLLGNHRLMCGDSTMIDQVEKLMNGEKANLCFTSPPYNGNTHLWYGKGKDKKLYQKNDMDNKSDVDYIKFCHDILSNIFHVTNGFVFWNVNYNANCRSGYIHSIYPFLEKLWETVVWKKKGMPVANGLTRDCEFIFIFKNNVEKKHLNKQFDTCSNLWEISNNNSQQNEHHACFPVELPEKAINLATKLNQNVYDPFGGSGTTLIACEKINRKCFMMEISPQYCDIIIKRWQKFTGKQAILESTKQTYDEVANG